MRPSGKFRASVHIPIELHEMLRYLAFKRRTTISDLIAAAIVKTYGEPDDE